MSPLLFLTGIWRDTRGIMPNMRISYPPGFAMIFQRTNKRATAGSPYRLTMGFGLQVAPTVFSGIKILRDIAAAVPEPEGLAQPLILAGKVQG